ncbi:hypothetical protein [Sulfitobacter sp. S190]|uniref:hypothetical protein n=1 Tax=Sulfitobacter sp. S190 TaxID=2867022 RepID=UPI0021A78C5C|nr:hypothetical protein [Sulfitobacter sp. S190]UWR21288.1 hypothetical protein K3756_11250 [Sulfitobacter sp. S190]
MKNTVYSVNDLVTEYKVTENTVSNWVKDGLVPSDSHRPFVFRGEVVVAFHKQRSAMRRRRLGVGEIYCRRCASAVMPHPDSIHFDLAKNGRRMRTGACPLCQGKIQVLAREIDCDTPTDCRNPNTPMGCQDEVKKRKHGDIWMCRQIDVPDVHFSNDRIIHKWQTYAARYSKKTVVKHLAAIRYFENCLSGKSFASLVLTDFAKVRDDLKRRADTDVADSLSASSNKHFQSHLIAFFDWLISQPGYRRLPRDFA